VAYYQTTVFAEKVELLIAGDLSFFKERIPPFTARRMSPAVSLP
jgi:hypothetical protein